MFHIQYAPWLHVKIYHWNSFIISVSKVAPILLLISVSIPCFCTSTCTCICAEAPILQLILLVLHSAPKVTQKNREREKRSPLSSNWDLELGTGGEEDTLLVWGRLWEECCCLKRFYLRCWMLMHRWCHFDSQCWLNVTDPVPACTQGSLDGP